MSKKDILKKEYYKNRTRIQRFVRSAEKRGYTFEENVLPKIPKRITEGSVRRLEKITPDYLYRKSTYTYTPPTGNTVTITGRQGRNVERESAATKGAITRGHNEVRNLIQRAKRETESFAEKVKEYAKLKEEQERENREKELRREIEETQRKLDELKSNLDDYEEPEDDFYDYGIYYDEPEIDDKREPHERYYAESDYEEGKGNEADEVADGLVTLRELIDSWTPSANWTESLAAAKEADHRVAKNVLDAAIAELGEQQVVRNVQAHGEELKDLLNHVLYDSGSREGNFKDGRTQVNADIKKFQELLLGHTLSQQEAMKTQELIEYHQHYEGE